MLIKYFTSNRNLDYSERLKTISLIILLIFGTTLSLISAIAEFFIVSENFIVSLYSKISLLVLFVLSFALLKIKGVKLAGNVVSLGLVIIVVIWMNILNENISPLYKFLHSFYSVFVLFTLGSIFASRTILIINAILILASTTRIYLYSLNILTDQKELITSSYINHTTVFIALVIIMVFINKLTESTINKIKEDNKNIHLKNQELTASDEEIRATNEELVVTTDALKETNKELQEAKGKAEESNKLKSQFLKNISHEIRTPLNGILGFVNLIINQKLDDETQNEYYNLINTSSEQLTRIIDDIVEISKLDTKQYTIINKEINLNEFLDQIYSMFESNNKIGINFSLHKEVKDKGVFINIDESKLYKIISSLLDNAFKFTIKGTISFGYSINEDFIDLYVNDTGIGICDEKQDIVFDRFIKAETDDRILYGGLGLGLSIAKENVLLLNGKIALKSEKNKGTEISVKIPYIPINK